MSNVAQVRESTVAFILNDKVAQEFDSKIPDVSKFAPNAKNYQSVSLEPSPTKGISVEGKDFANQVISTAIQQLSKVGGGEFGVNTEGKNLGIFSGTDNVKQR